MGRMGFSKSIKSIVGYIWQSPSNKGQKLYRLFLAAVWQIYKRLVGLPIISRLDNGYKFILEPNSTNSTGNIYVKTYEAEYIYFLRKHVVKGGLILDIGAHMGIYTLLLKDLFTGGYCFEPAKDNFVALKNNLFINGIIEEFIPLNAAVSETNSNQVFKIEGGFSGINYLIEEDDGHNSQTEMVHAVSIDDFLNQKGNKEVINFIKIDTEGHELKVLRGSLDTIKKNPQLIILFENSAPSGLHQLFLSINFKVFSIDRNGTILSDENNILNAYNLFAIGIEHPLFKEIL